MERWTHLSVKKNNNNIEKERKKGKKIKREKERN